MSKGVRLYEHDACRRRIERDSYNVATGLQMVRELKRSKLLEIFATGCEEGAMVVHYKWRR